MPDNVLYTPGTGATIAARLGTYSGDSALAQAIGLVTFSGSDDAKTITDVPAGSGVEATALRVTIASDSTGVLSVDDNGGSLTIDGTVAATQSGTWNVTNISGTITLPTGAATEATLSTLNGKVTACNTGAVVLAAGTANVGDVDVLTVPADPFGVNADAGSATGSISAKLRFIASTGIPVTGTVTVAAHAVTNAGTFVVQVDGAALTSLQLLDDGIATVASAITTKGMAAVGTDGTNARILKTDTSGELQVDVLTLPALVAGSANIGDVDVLTLPALVAGTANIGDVDVLTVPADPFGVNADAGSATGSISAKLRFIAATGIPITGTVTVASHAVTNAGTFVVQENGAALTALQLIDDTVVAQGTALGSTKNSLIAGSVTTASPSYTTGQISPLSLDTAGSLRVAIISGAGSGGTAIADDAAFTLGTTNITPAGGVYVPAKDAVNSGDAGAFAMTEYRAMHAHLVDAAGDPIAVGGGTQYTNDAALPTSGTAGVGTLAMGRASAAAPSDVSADNDAVSRWHLRNGAAATVLTAAGALIGGDATNGLDVDVTRLPALVAGTANIGDVDVLTVPAPLSTTGNGTAATALRVTVASDSTGQVVLAAGTAEIGKLAAGVANIGDVDVLTLPALVAGTANIGDVDVLTLPALVAGSAIIGKVGIDQTTPGTTNAVQANVASGGIASGAIASGAVASGAIASGAIASGAIAVGAIAAGATSIADNEDVASADGDRAVKILFKRLDTPANSSGTDGDYEQPQMSAGRVWTSTVQTASAVGTALSTMNATSSDGGTALTSTAQVIKASAGKLMGYYIYNPNATAQFVQFYNTAAGSVTVGTTNPLFMLTIPATSAANLMGETGIAFTNAGWSWAATSTAGGNGAPTTALDAVAWYI